MPAFSSVATVKFRRLQRWKDDSVFSDKRDPSNTWSHEQLEYFFRWSAEIIVADWFFRGGRG